MQICFPLINLLVYTISYFPRFIKMKRPAVHHTFQIYSQNKFKGNSNKEAVNILLCSCMHTGREDKLISPLSCGFVLSFAIMPFLLKGLTSKLLLNTLHYCFMVTVFLVLGRSYYVGRQKDHKHGFLILVSCILVFPASSFYLNFFLFFFFSKHSNEEISFVRTESDKHYY